MNGFLCNATVEGRGFMFIMFSIRQQGLQTDAVHYITIMLHGSVCHKPSSTRWLPKTSSENELMDILGNLGPNLMNLKAIN